MQEVSGQLANVCQQVLNCKPEPGRNVPFCDLDVVEDIPIMPTLSGWLLQYPVVYLAGAQTASKLASLLSDATLELHQVQISGTLIQVSVMLCLMCSL